MRVLAQFVRDFNDLEITAITLVLSLSVMAVAYAIGRQYDKNGE